MHLLKKFWTLTLLFFIEIVLFITNYKPGTYLAGWDGLYPELNFPANLERNIFAIWQEYRGVGLYDGMSYAANFPHTLFLWLASSVLPQDFLRYFFMFLMHGVGVISMYFLLKKLFPTPSSPYAISNNIYALFGGLFYGFNLGIIQMFYAPLEVFAIHFAFLPLLVLSLFSYLEFPNWKKLGIFALFSFLATPQGFVPQIFLSYLLLIFSILGTYLLINRPDSSLKTGVPGEVFYVKNLLRRGYPRVPYISTLKRLEFSGTYNKKSAVQIVAKAVGVIFCINAFWLIPYVYGVPQNAPIIMNSKINQMASNKIYVMNHIRGNLIDVLTFKGFMLDTAEYTNQKYSYTMQEWRDYTATPLFILPSILFALLMLFGLYKILENNMIGFYPFIAAGLVSFFFLGNDVWGLNVLNALLRLLLPIFNEAFRFPFTKFEILFAFCYTILLSVGLSQTLQLLSEYSKKSGHQKHQIFRLSESLTNRLSGLYLIFLKFFSMRRKKRFKTPLFFRQLTVSSYVLILSGLFLFLFCLPVFLGHFLFGSVRVKMEPEYKKVITFLNNQPSLGRIATLPQPTFYNWEYHENNYRGSGFLWYGIPQATLERSFDPWSNYNENYYWELSQALYSHNPDSLKKVFTKYQVSIVMFDENLIYPFATKSLQIEETKDMLSKIGAKEIIHTGKVTLFSLPTSTAPVFVADNLPTVNSYTWSDNDTFYKVHGDYIASENPNIILPFRSLFSNREDKGQSVHVEKATDHITISSILPAGTKNVTLPSFSLIESFMPADLVYNKHTREVSLLLRTPRVALGTEPISGESLTEPLFTLPPHSVFPLTLTVNNEPSVTMTSEENTSLGTFLLPVAQNTYVTITDTQKDTVTAMIPKDTIQQTYAKPVSVSISDPTTSFPITVTIPQTNAVFSPRLANVNVINCNTLSPTGSVTMAKAGGNELTLSAVHADACLSFFDQEAQSDQGYLLSLKTSHITGEPLSLWTEDPSEQFSFLYTQLSPTTQTSYFFLPPRESYNLGYAIHLENVSTGESLTKNTLSNITLSPFPYQFLSQIVADRGENLHAVTKKDVAFLHPNPSLYDVSEDFSGMDNPTLVLSQAYDPGWHAYEVIDDPSPLNELFPFSFGTELSGHMKVNNWENGWQITHATPGNHIVIIFIPQYLEYGGFILLIACGLFFLLQAIPIPQSLTFF